MDIINYRNIVKYWSSRILFFSLFAISITFIWLAPHLYIYSESSSTELSEYIYKYRANHIIINENDRNTKK